ncbi:L-idonate 5-dehydrogenase [Litoreibacter sp.]|nr:L-idonate 5-dehydrogenase [Litoreibacter sp.]
MKTRLCRLHGQKDIRIETADVPALKTGQVLVQMGAGGICGSDLHYYQDGGFGPIRIKEPIVLGHEVAGAVRAIAADVTGLEPGDRVAVNPSHPCGDCRFCTTGLFEHCLNMRFFGSALRYPHEQGAFRDRMVVGAAQCVVIKDSVTMAEAACAEPLAVCLHARNRAPDLRGRRVLVTGAGPIGVLCAALAAEAGASEVVVTDLQDTPLNVAKQMGATQVVNVASNPSELEQGSTEKGHFDVAFECSAAVPAIQSAFTLVRPQGTVVQVGVRGDTPIPINALVGKEINLIGSHRFHGEFADAVELICNGAIDPKPMITGIFALENAVEAFEVAGDRRRAVKSQLSFTSD